MNLHRGGEREGKGEGNGGKEKKRNGAQESEYVEAMTGAVISNRGTWYGVRWRRARGAQGAKMCQHAREWVVGRAQSSGLCVCGRVERWCVARLYGE